MMPDDWQWLRPLWLLGLLPLIVTWWWVIRRHQAGSGWDAWVDAELQPYVLSSPSPGSKIPVHLLFLCWLLCVLVLAGPVWQQQPVPVYESRPSLVAVMDVSPSMNLDDLKPTRMQRAVFKLSDLLDRAVGIELGLLVFAERPYVISPITDDVNTLQAFLPSLSTELAPVRGSNLHLAIDKAVELLQQAGKQTGQIVLFTDSDIDDRDIASAKRAKGAGYTVSVIGVGTKNGAPLRSNEGGFVYDANGSIVVPKVNVTELQQLGQAGGGASTLITRSGKDIDTALRLSNDSNLNSDEPLQQDNYSDYWIEQGVWLLPVLALLSLGLFRRGLFL